ncbi:MAG: hypothetical protein ACREE6_02985 [Limisphaerales bacterium]
MMTAAVSVAASLARGAFSCPPCFEIREVFLKVKRDGAMQIAQSIKGFHTKIACPPIGNETFSGGAI